MWRAIADNEPNAAPSYRNPSAVTSTTWVRPPCALTSRVPGRSCAEAGGSGAGARTGCDLVRGAAGGGAGLASAAAAGAAGDMLHGAADVAWAGSDMLHAAADGAVTTSPGSALHARASAACRAATARSRAIAGATSPLARTCSRQAIARSASPAAFGGSLPNKARQRSAGLALAACVTDVSSEAGEGSARALRLTRTAPRARAPTGQSRREGQQPSTQS